MAVSIIQSSLLPLQVSVDQTNWEDVVCAQAYNIARTRTTNKEETLNCGVLVGIGPQDVTVSGTAICNTTPTPTQVSYNTMSTWFSNATQIYFRVQNPSSGSIGAFIYLEGACIVSQLELQVSPSTLIKFTFTLSGQGLPTDIAGGTV